MKTMYLLFIILTSCCTNLFGQYFIGQDKIDQAKDKRGYYAKPDDVNNKKIYLQSIINTNGYTSDIKIGFDKTEYKPGDVIIITVTLPARSNVNGRKERVELGKEIFYLQPGESRHVRYYIPENSQIALRLYFNLGSGFPYSYEERSYIIAFKQSNLKKVENNNNIESIMQTEGTPLQEVHPIHPDTGEKCYFTTSASTREEYKYFIETNVATKPNNSNYVNDNAVSSKNFATATTITVSGTIQYRDLFFPYTSLLPVNHWVLRIFSSSNQSDLNPINSNAVVNDYPITSSNGSYTKAFTLNETYFKAATILRRFDGSNETYKLGRYEIRNNGQDTVLVEYYYTTNMLNNTQTNVTYDHIFDITNPVDPIKETLRRLAHIGNRIDKSISTNVGGDNLATIQSLWIGTREDHGVIPDNSFSTVLNDQTKLNYIQIGPRTFDLTDATIMHEHGHTLMYNLTNYEWRAGGDHYIDQKNRPGMAFSEGWANFWACAVMNDYNLLNVFSLNLSNVTKSYIYSITNTTDPSTYFPNSTTLYDGVENEALVAAAFWELKNSTNLSSVWNGLKSQISNGVTNRAVKNILEYFAANTSLKNSFYSDPNRTEELGLGRNFSFLVNTTNLQNTIPALGDKTLIYLQDGTYSVSSKIIIDGKSFGIFGMSPKGTILIGQANQNTINITNPNSNNDWVKISDLQFRNGGFACDALASGTNQPRLYMSRCISISNLRGVCFGGDAIILNNFILDNKDWGIYITSKGAARKLYIYNNVINNSGTGLRFNNSVNISGYIANNMFSKNDNGIASVDPNALANSLSGINFEYNGMYPNAIENVGLTVSNSYFDNPVYSTIAYWCNVNFYEDKGINLSSNDPIFEDLYSENLYGNKRNWVGAYGGKQAHIYQTTLLPSSSAFQFTPAASISGQNVWSGTVNITSDVTINSGASVTIIPGTNLIFSDDKSLTVNGILTAIGNSDNPITFTSASGTSPESWGTIKLNGSGASGSIIKYADISYGTQVEALNVSNFEISNCNFTDNYKAVYVNNSSGSISNNYLTSNSIGHSILIENASSVDCRKNVIKKTSPNQQRGSGIQYGGGSNGYVWQNDITQCDWGFGAIWGSSPDFYNTVTEVDYRNNRITNCNYGVRVYKYSYPVIGEPSPPYGVSTIYGNDVADVSLNMDGVTNSNMDAAEVYWENGNPANAVFQVHSGSHLYTSPYSTTDEWASYPLPSIMQTPENTKGEPREVLAKMQSANNEIAIQETSPIMNGINLRHQNKYKEAKNYFISYLAGHPDDQRAYVELYNCYSKETVDDLISFFKNLPSEASKDHKLLLSYLYLRESRNAASEAESERDIELAEKTNNSIIKENPNTSLSVRAKMNNIYIALYSENDLAKASSIFA